MNDVVRVKPGAVAAVASDLAWRSKLYGGLAIGGGVLVALWTVMSIVRELDLVSASDRDDVIVGAATFLVVATALAVWGFMFLAKARRLTRAATQALSDPTADWIVLGREVRSTDPRGTGAAPCTFKVSGGRRDLLVRERAES